MVSLCIHTCGRDEVKLWAAPAVRWPTISKMAGPECCSGFFARERGDRDNLSFSAWYAAAQGDADRHGPLGFAMTGLLVRTSGDADCHGTLEKRRKIMDEIGVFSVSPILPSVDQHDYCMQDKDKKRNCRNE